jgi:hypothetical protein
MRYPIDLMDSQHKILFYGNSLVLAGVQETFNAYPGFETMASGHLVTEAELLILDPTVVVFDMGATESEFLLAQMQELPGALLIGIDLESHQVLLTGQAVCSISLDQITQIVRDLSGPKIVHSVPLPGKDT